MALLNRSSGQAKQKGLLMQPFFILFQWATWLLRWIFLKHMVHAPTACTKSHIGQQAADQRHMIPENDVLNHLHLLWHYPVIVEEKRCYDREYPK